MKSSFSTNPCSVILVSIFSRNKFLMLPSASSVSFFAFLTFGRRRNISRFPCCVFSYLRIWYLSWNMKNSQIVKLGRHYKNPIRCFIQFCKNQSGIKKYSCLLVLQTSTNRYHYKFMKCAYVPNSGKYDDTLQIKTYKFQNFWSSK